MELLGSSGGLVGIACEGQSVADVSAWRASIEGRESEVGHRAVEGSWWKCLQRLANATRF